MFTEMNRELARLSSDTERARKLEAMISDLKRQLERLKNQEALLSQQWEKENKNFERISESGLSSFIYTLLGTREERIDKEEREALAAKLKLEQCRSQIRTIEDRRAQMEQEYSEKKESEFKYKQLLQKKKDMILSEHSDRAEQIFNLQKELSACEARAKEIDEAILAGNNVMNAIRRMIDHLDSAEGWSTWDLLGGGLLSDFEKHSHIDEANISSGEVNRLLSNFHSELADLQINTNQGVEIDDFLKFTDFFFDDFISDWMVRSKIVDSLRDAQELSSQVNTLLNKLHSLNADNGGKVAELRSKIASILSNV